MNTFDHENTAAYNRQRAIEIIDGIRYERRLIYSRVYYPGLFERAMLRIANWMIAVGKQLRRRYELPGACTPLTSEHLVH